MELVKLKKKSAIIDSADQKMPFLARYPYFFDILGLAGTKIKSWIVKSVLRILIEGLVAEINAFSRFRPSKAFTLSLTVATKKAKDQIFWPVVVGWAIGEAPAQNWPQG